MKYDFFLSKMNSLTQMAIFVRTLVPKRYTKIAGYIKDVYSTLNMAIS